jgi:tripartite-type tricarboxylate transporter receptor subunit TctC
VSVNAIAPSLFPNLQYDVLKDFAPVTLAASVPHFVVVHPSLPVHSIRELIAYARERPGKLSFPSAGNGSTPHLAGEIFKSMAGVDLVHVPYKGSGQSMADLLAGQHQVAFDTAPASAGNVRSGRMRVLGVSSAHRLPEYPDVPTVAEAGVPGYEVITWYGVFAPGGTPPAIVNRLHAETARAMESPAVHARLAEAGADGSVTRSPEEFAAIVRADTARYAKIIKDAGLKID